MYSCLQTPPKENWFQYVRREYATAAINFPCLNTLIPSVLSHTLLRISLSTLFTSTQCKQQSIYQYAQDKAFIIHLSC